MHGQTIACLLTALTIAVSASNNGAHATEGVSIRYDRSDPRLEFAAEDVRRALAETGYIDWWKILDNVKNEVETVRNETDAD